MEIGHNTSLKDDLGNTALLCAAENGQIPTLKYLMEHSPWHTVNAAQKTFLDIIIDGRQPTRDSDIDILRTIIGSARTVSSVSAEHDDSCT